MLVKTHYVSLIVLLLFSVPYFVGAQNLVINPSFEYYVDCPVKLGNLEQDVENWNMPTLGSTDYFNGCSTAMGTPKNFNGQQPADFGVGYVGLYMYAPNDYREYIEGKLSSTLQKGEVYEMTFYVSLAERSDFAVKEFGIRFTEFPVQVETTKVLSGMHFSKLQGDTSNEIEISYSKYYSDEIEWVKLTTQFIANGTENYMIIGNFKNNRRTQKFQTKRKITKGSYYYLDMVSVNHVNLKAQDTKTASAKEYELNRVHVFKDVYFNFNRSKIRGSHQQEMESLLSYLKANANVNIKLIGHTDSIGSDAFNQKLSLRRATEVADFLSEQGVSLKRIQLEGVGSSNPISTNKTEAGRLLNRRVEFILNRLN